MIQCIFDLFIYVITSKIFLIIWFIYAILITYILYNIVFKKLRYLDKQKNVLKDEYLPFYRYDRDLWNFPEMVFCGIFLLPIRAFGIISSMVIFVLVTQLFGKVTLEDSKKEFSWFKRFVIQNTCSYLSKLIVFCIGFLNVKYNNVKIEDFDGNYKKPEKNPPIIISNHVSWVDIQYFSSTKFCPSYLSKAEIANYPLWGTAAKALQSVFLARYSQEERDSISKSISERCEHILNGKNFPPLLIFPEGTTSNGKYIISFKKGAFAPLVPVKIFCIKYIVRHFNPAMDSISQLHNFLLFTCQLYNKLEVYEFTEPYYPTTENLKSDQKLEQWEIFASNVKNIMLKCLNLKDSESGLRQKVEYHKQIQYIMGDEKKYQ